MLFPKIFAFIYNLFSTIKGLKKPYFLKVFPNTFAFGLYLGLAYFLKWETSELIWSLWFFSLVFGIMCILSNLVGRVYYEAAIQEGFKNAPIIAIFSCTIPKLYSYGFAIFWFSAFHAGHSTALQDFFPIDCVPRGGFGPKENALVLFFPPLLWKNVFEHLMLPYGFSLIPMIISEKHRIFGILNRAVNEIRTKTISKNLAFDSADLVLGKEDPLPLYAFFSVIRFHLLIFFFAFIQNVLKIDSFLVYIVVFFCFYFPWKEFVKLKE